MLRILSYLTLTDLMEKGIALSTTWRKILTSSEDEMVKKMLQWTQYMKINKSYQYAVNEDDEDEPLSRREVYKTKLRKKKLVLHLNSKYEKMAEDGHITFKKVELLTKISDIIVIEVDYQTFRLIQVQ